MRKAICLMAVVALSFFATPAAQANTKVDTWCTVTSAAPRTDGVKVYSVGAITCSAGITRGGKIESRIREKVGPAWVYRGNSKYNYSSGSANLSVQAVYTCNGHGTDVWGGRAIGETIKGKSGIDYSNQRSLTC